MTGLGLLNNFPGEEQKDDDEQNKSQIPSKKPIKTNVAAPEDSDSLREMKVFSFVDA